MKESKFLRFNAILDQALYLQIWFGMVHNTMTTWPWRLIIFRSAWKKYVFFAFDTYWKIKPALVPNPLPFLKHVANKGGWPDLHVLRKRPKENLQNCEYARFAEFARRHGSIGNSRQRGVHQVIKNESPFHSFASNFEICTGSAHNIPYSANEMHIFWA